MTVRAITIGSLLALAVAVFGYTIDWWLRLSYVASDLMPISAYGLLVLAVLLVNPLLGLARRRFTPGELAVMFSLMLAACVIPGPGLLWHFNNTLIAPLHYAQVNPGWKECPEHPDLIAGYVPPIMLANGGRYDELAVKGFMDGLTGKDQWLSAGEFGEILRKSWLPTYSFYLPLLSLTFVGLICLTVVLHRQWADREHLPYPIAEVANELIRADPDRAFNPLFRNVRFWVGFLLAVGVLLANGLVQFYPSMVSLPMSLDLAGLGEVWPKLTSVSPYWNLLAPNFYFAPIGLAFLLSAEVSFSIGISSVAYTLFFLGAVSYGADMSWDYMNGGALPSLLFGAYVGGGVVILYTGRKFYAAVLRRSLGLHSPEAVERAVVRACRGFLAASAGAVAMLHWVLGLDLLLSALLLGLVTLLFVIVTRINAETGLLFVQPTWHAAPVLLGLFGAPALGPKAMVMAGILSLVLTVDPRVCLMPLVANALKVSDRQGVSPGRVGWAMAGVLVVCLAAGVIGTLYFQYNRGTNNLYAWANEQGAKPFEMLKGSIDSGLLDVPHGSDGWGGLERLGSIQPSGRFCSWVGLGLALMLVTSAARLRWTWWPIHPVLFMVWGTIISGRYAPSFLLGWLCKAAVTRFGGGKGYARARPVFIGMIAGELAMGIVWMIVLGVYFLKYDQPGPWIRVH